MGAVMIPTSYLTRESYRRSFEQAPRDSSQSRRLRRAWKRFFLLLTPWRQP